MGYELNDGIIKLTMGLIKLIMGDLTAYLSNVEKTVILKVSVKWPLNCESFMLYYYDNEWKSGLLRGFWLSCLALNNNSN